MNTGELTVINMKYPFPVIENIRQIADVIADNPAFVTNHKGHYSVVNYMYTSPLVFPDVVHKAYDDFEIYDNDAAILRECRGIAFDGVGDIISRPFHKFFNYGERKETTNIELPFYYEDKLDGSMIRPLYIRGSKIRLATKMGVTDIALQAENYASDKENLWEFIHFCGRKGFTPIFEWCSRYNQIVIQYDEPQLVLLAIRDTITGVYLTPTEVDMYAEKYDVPVVKRHTSKPDVASIKEMEGQEGFVLVYPDGHRVKIKSDWYVALHRAKDNISREKDLIKLILEDKLDDLKALLIPSDLEQVEKFEIKFWEGFNTVAHNIIEMYKKHHKKENNSVSRKSFAMSVKEEDYKFHHFMFKLFDGENINQVIKNVILKHCSSGPKVDTVRWLFNNARYEGFSLNA